MSYGAAGRTRGTRITAQVGAGLGRVYSKQPTRADFVRRRVTGGPGLGFVLPADIVASVASGLIHPSSSATNLADNATLYARAITGNTQALVNLATVSGQQGQVAGIPNAGVMSVTSTPIWRSGIGATLNGGWGPTDAQADAVQKYQAAVQALGGGTPVGIPVQGGSNGTFPGVATPQPSLTQSSMFGVIPSSGGGSSTMLVLGGIALLFVLAQTLGGGSRQPVIIRE